MKLNFKRFCTPRKREKHFHFEQNGYNDNKSNLPTWQRSLTMTDQFNFSNKIAKIMTLRSSGGKPSFVDSYHGPALKPEQLKFTPESELGQSFDSLRGYVNEIMKLHFATWETKLDESLLGCSKVWALDVEGIASRISTQLLKTHTKIMQQSLTESKKLESANADLGARMKALENAVFKYVELAEERTKTDMKWSKILDQLLEQQSCLLAEQIERKKWKAFKNFLNVYSVLQHWKAQDKPFSTELFSTWLDHHPHLPFSWKEIENKEKYCLYVENKLREQRGVLADSSSLLEALNVLISDLRAENLLLRMQAERLTTQTQIKLNKTLRRGVFGGLPMPFVPVHSKSYETMLEDKKAHTKLN